MNYITKIVCLIALTISVSFAIADDQSSGKKYKSVYVSTVVVEADMDRTKPDEVKYYADLETEATAMITKFFKDEGYAIADAPDASNDRQITINTKAIFNAGNRALRWVGGIIGAGKASADVTMEAIDSLGKVVTSKSAQNTMRMGGFGGSAPGLLMGVIDSAWNSVIGELSEAK